MKMMTKAMFIEKGNRSGDDDDNDDHDNDYDDDDDDDCDNESASSRLPRVIRLRSIAMRRTIVHQTLKYLSLP